MSASPSRRRAPRRAIVAGLWSLAALAGAGAILFGRPHPVRAQAEFPYEVSRYSMNYNRFRYEIVPDPDGHAQTYRILHGSRGKAREVGNMGVTAGSHVRFVNRFSDRMRISFALEDQSTIFGFGKSKVEIPAGGSVDLRVQPHATKGATSKIEIEVLSGVTGQSTPLEYLPSDALRGDDPVDDPIGDPKLKVKGG